MPEAARKASPAPRPLQVRAQPFPKSIACFARPTFSSGLFGLILAVAGLKIVIQVHCPVAGTVAEVAFMFVTVPMTPLGLILSAWKQGLSRFSGCTKRRKRKSHFSIWLTW
jgi:hypothetical protein